MNIYQITVLTNPFICSPPPNLHFPIGITLASSKVDRAISVSTDNGVNYFSVTPDITGTNAIYANINAAITNIKVVANVNDILSIGW